MTKRKSDSATHESRLDYQNRKEDDKTASTADEGSGSFDRASPSTLQSRTIRKAGRSERRQRYFKKMAKLNKAFAEWAAARTRDLDAKLSDPAYDGETAEREFYFYATSEYLRRAKEIQETYARDHGDVLTFGSGDCGQLGLRLMKTGGPCIVKSLRDGGITLVSCGGLHNAALDEGGLVYTWGCNDEGSLGQGSDTTNYVPLVLSGFRPSNRAVAVQGRGDGESNQQQRADEKEAMIWVATGNTQTLFLSMSGRVYMCGAYKDSEGKQWRDMKPTDDPRPDFNPEKFDSKPAPRYKQEFPIHVYQMPRLVKSIACGGDFNVAVLDDETLVTWGISECGELARPVPNLRLSDGTHDIDAIKNHYLTPKAPIWAGPEVATRRVVSVGCGTFHLLVAVAEGDKEELAVYSSGLNNYGQLGHGDIKNRDKLTRIEALDGCDIVKVDGGVHHSLCLDSSGRSLYAFGRGDSGQLGITNAQPPAGYTESSPQPVPLVFAEDGQPAKEQPVITQFSCGGNHNLVVTEEGDAYSWGYGDMGALGLATDVDEDAVEDEIEDEEEKNMDEEDEEEEKDADEEEEDDVVEDAFRPTKLWDAKTRGRKAKQVAGGGQHSAIIVTHTTP